MSTQNLTLGDILKKAENNAGGIGISAEDIRVATSQLIGEENKEFLPYGQLITDGKAFENCNDSLKEALARGHDVEGSVLCAIVGRDVVVTESGKKDFKARDKGGKVCLWVNFPVKLITKVE